MTFPIPAGEVALWVGSGIEPAVWVTNVVIPAFAGRTGCPILGFVCVRMIFLGSGGPRQGLVE